MYNPTRAPCRAHALQPLPRASWMAVVLLLGLCAGCGTGPSATATPEDATALDVGPTCACDDGNECTVDTCLTDGACSHAVRQGSCDDGDACTSDDRCNLNGDCQGDAGGCAGWLGGLGSGVCRLDGQPPTPGGVQLVPAFPNVDLPGAIFLTHPHDGTDRVAVALRDGRVALLANNDATSGSVEMVDIRDQVDTGGEGGLLSLAFHPDYATNRRLFLSFVRKPGFVSVIAEVKVGPDDKADMSTWRDVLTLKQPYKNHNGGQILFAQDGTLLIGFGDGGSANDPLNAGQDPSTWLGKVLRIDVDDVEEGEAYAVPADNPFLQSDGFLPEIYALGLRNPWRMSMDRLSGDVFMADVGQGKFEEVSVLRAGGNYGWKVFEANDCFSAGAAPGGCDEDLYDAPIVSYPHSEGKSITGGYVYRGSAWPALEGHYVYGDYASTRLWAARPTTDGWETRVVNGSSGVKVVSFGESRDGELFALQLFGASTVYRVTAEPEDPNAPQLPTKLSQTGCFIDMGKLKPAAGVVPFDVNAPLWSDGAFKRRFIVPPPSGDGGHLLADMPDDDEQVWLMPVGTLLIKHFWLGGDGSDPGAPDARPIETRFERRTTTGWEFYTYVWDEIGADATLSLGGATIPLSYKDGAGAAQTGTWRAPSQGECVSCHGEAGAPSPLSVRTTQLRRPWSFAPNGAGSTQQLDVFFQSGVMARYRGHGLHKAWPTHDAALDWPETTAELGKLARVYLHVQCGSCHQPGGTAPGDLDLRAHVPLGETNACEVAPSDGDLGTGAPYLIAPGAPNDSVLALRMGEQPGAQAFMPNLGVRVRHDAGLALVREWISRLNSCEP